MTGAVSNLFGAALLLERNILNGTENLSHTVYLAKPAARRPNPIVMIPDMHAFPELYTERLKLRKIQAEDIPSLIKYANNKKISDYILNIPHPYDEPQAVFRIGYALQGFKNKSRFVFGVTLKEGGELIGEISLHIDSDKKAQLGYWIGEPFWGKGIASEAVKAILKFGFDRLNLEEIYATCHTENTASYKVLLNNGMKKQADSGAIVQYNLIKPDGLPTGK